ncbi:MAG: hypothetical protein AAF902_25205 [Chloroflexota bacterium]
MIFRSKKKYHEVPQKYTWPLLLGAIAAFLLLISQYLSNVNKYDLYVHSSGMFSLEVPSNWSKRDLNGGRFKGRTDVYFMSGNRLFFPSNKSVFVYLKSAEDPKSEDAKLWGEKLINDIDGQMVSKFTEIESFIDQHAVTEIYSRSYVSKSGKRMHFYFLSRNNIAVVDMVPYDPESESTELFDHMISTFVLTPTRP